MPDANTTIAILAVFLLIFVGGCMSLGRKAKDTPPAIPTTGRRAGYGGDPSIDPEGLRMEINCDHNRYMEQVKAVADQIQAELTAEHLDYMRSKAEFKHAIEERQNGIDVTGEFQSLPDYRDDEGG